MSPRRIVHLVYMLSPNGFAGFSRCIEAVKRQNEKVR
jgi:hypothetical protein